MMQPYLTQASITSMTSAILWIVKRRAEGNLVRWKDPADRGPWVVPGVREAGKTFLVERLGYSSEGHGVSP